jgi:hypothetical protein
LYFQQSRSKDTPRASLGCIENFLEAFYHATIIDNDKSDNEPELALIDMHSECGGPGRVSRSVTT